MCEICSKLMIKTPGLLFFVGFEYISHLFIVFLLMTLDMLMLVGLTYQLQIASQYLFIMKYNQVPKSFREMFFTTELKY